MLAVDDLAACLVLKPDREFLGHAVRVAALPKVE